jgi:hypothetical protein
MDAYTGKFGVVEGKVLRNSCCVRFSDDVSWNYPADVLRKLSDEEIARRLNGGQA